MDNKPESAGGETYNGQPITDGVTAGIEVRKQRGLEIAALARIEKKDGFYLVPSQTSPRPTKYKVWSNPAKPVFTCNCPDHETRRCNCKHIYAVIYTMRREAGADGSETITESITVTKTRKTYAQDWPNYNAAQVHEREHFQTLLRDVCSTIEEPTDGKPRRGRPRISMADAVFSIIHKVYSTHSGRRFSSELADAKESGLVARAPHYNSCFRYIENPDLFPVLVGLIERTSLPLRSVESAICRRFNRVRVLPVHSLVRYQIQPLHVRAALDQGPFVLRHENQRGNGNRDSRPVQERCPSAAVTGRFHGQEFRHERSQRRQGLFKL